MSQRLSLVAFCLLFGTTLAAAQDKEKKPIVLKISLPRDDATLMIDDKEMDLPGKNREVKLPAADPDKEVAHVIQATIIPNNYTTIVRTRKIKVKGGSTVEVDMLQNNPKEPDEITIRFVPTPPEIVEAMLKLAKVGKDDVVYDLGCGDGRMVIAAVKSAGAKRGVGIDLDPERVKESLENVRKEGVGKAVEIREGDVLKVQDISDASVVLLYMGNELNEALKPILQKQLKPGSRIVSHRFLMGAWKPAESKSINGNDGSKYDIHLWIVGK